MKNAHSRDFPLTFVLVKVTYIHIYVYIVLLSTTFFLFSKLIYLINSSYDSLIK